MALSANDKSWIRQYIRKALREELGSFGSALVEHLAESSSVQQGGYDGVHPFVWEDGYEEGRARIGFNSRMVVRAQVGEDTE